MPGILAVDQAIGSNEIGRQGRLIQLAAAGAELPSNVPWPFFQAGAAAVAAFRQQDWAADAITPNAVLHIVQLPPITHNVPLKAIERWLRTPSVSPKEDWEAILAADRRGSDVEVEFKGGVIAQTSGAEVVLVFAGEHLHIQ